MSEKAAALLAKYFFKPLCAAIAAALVATSCAAQAPCHAAAGDVFYISGDAATAFDNFPDAPFDTDAASGDTPFSDAPFASGDAPVAALSMPRVYYEALSLIISEEERASVTAVSERYFAEGRRDKAASVIGRALGSKRGFSLFYLGRFCQRTLPTAGVVEAQAEFLSGFMRGYSGRGVLMFTTRSVKSFFAYPAKRGAPWRRVADEAPDAAGDERVYEGKGVVFIPFDYGSKFIVDVAAKEGDGVKMWKILPDKVTYKSWGGGTWEKEITVLGFAKK